MPSAVIRSTGQPAVAVRASASNCSLVRFVRGDRATSGTLPVARRDRGASAATARRPVGAGSALTGSTVGAIAGTGLSGRVDFTQSTAPGPGTGSRVSTTDGTG